MSWLLWLGIGVLLIGAEVVSGEFVLIMLGGGALAGAGAAALTGGSLVAGVIVFVLVSAGLLVLGRPALKRKLEPGEHLESLAESLQGKRAVVLAAVDDHSGRVKLEGEEWTARSATPGMSFQPGDSVVVVGINGATAMVAEGA